MTHHRWRDSFSRRRSARRALGPGRGGRSCAPRSCNEGAINGTFRIGVADRLSGYVDGAAITWTNFNTPGTPSVTGRAVALEITGS